MDDTGVGVTWRELDPADYMRLMEAAKRRANALRREAGERFWRELAVLVMQGLRRSPAAGVARTSKAQGVASHRLEG
jgi:hypothetical protein